MLFSIYIKPLSSIIDSHSIMHHSFSYDLQLHMSVPSDKITELLHSMQSCMSDVKAWITANMLNLLTTRLNSCLSSTKTCITMTYILSSLSAMLQFPSNSPKNLCFALDCHLTMNAHVSNISRTFYFELRRLASIR